MPKISKIRVNVLLLVVLSGVVVAVGAFTLAENHVSALFMSYITMCAAFGKDIMSGDAGTE